MAAREHSITRCGILRVKIYSVTSADVRMLPRCNLLAWSRCSRRTKADSQTIYSLFIITPQYWHFCFSKLGVSIIKINAALIQLSLVFYMHIFMTLEQSLSFYNSHLQWKIRRRRRRKRRKKNAIAFKSADLIPEVLMGFLPLWSIDPMWISGSEVEDSWGVWGTLAYDWVPRSEFGKFFCWACQILKLMLSWYWYSIEICWRLGAGS